MAIIVALGAGTAKWLRRHGHRIESAAKSLSPLPEAICAATPGGRRRANLDNRPWSPPRGSGDRCPACPSRRQTGPRTRGTATVHHRRPARRFASPRPARRENRRDAKPGPKSGGSAASHPAGLERAHHPLGRPGTIIVRLGFRQRHELRQRIPPYWGALRERFRTRRCAKAARRPLQRLPSRLEKTACEGFPSLRIAL